MDFGGLSLRIMQPGYNRIGAELDRSSRKEEAFGFGGDRRGLQWGDLCKKRQGMK